MDKLPTSTVCCDSVLLPNPIFHQDDFVRSALKSTQTENPAKSLDAVRKYVARGPGASFFPGDRNRFRNSEIQDKETSRKNNNRWETPGPSGGFVFMSRCQRLVLDTFSANKNSGEFPAGILKASKLEEAIQNEERTNGGDARELRFGAKLTDCDVMDEYVMDSPNPFFSMMMQNFEKYIINYIYIK